MKTPAIAALRRKLAAQEPTFGLWVTLESPTITEMAVALGFDWVVLDAEHGHLDWKELVEHLRATARSETVALIRLAELNGGLIKRALDIGADGVVIPWIETAEQLREAIAWAKFPLEGRRGIGGERATCWGQALVEHTAEANEHVIVMPIIESVRGAANVQELVAVEGADYFYFGPADFSSTAGYRGQWEGPGVADEIVRAKDVLRAAGKQCGVIATNPEDLQRRLAQGFRLIGLGMDAGLLARSLRGLLAQVGRDRGLNTALTPNGESPAAHAAAPRLELVVDVENAKGVELAPGVEFQLLAGTATGAQGITTGIVTFAPGAALPHHTHPFTEAITVLHGNAVCEIEGRIHQLGPFDQMTIPREIVHQSRNESAEPTVFHIAMGTNAPVRTDVDASHLVRRLIAPDTADPANPERVTRLRTAKRQTIAGAVQGIAQYDGQLVVGVEMSGGYLLLHPGEQLVHVRRAADESVFVVRGVAVVEVEGRRHELSAGQAMTIPAGYPRSIRSSGEVPLELLWTHAAP